MQKKSGISNQSVIAFLTLVLTPIGLVLSSLQLRCYPDLVLQKIVYIIASIAGVLCLLFLVKTYFSNWAYKEEHDSLITEKAILSVSNVFVMIVAIAAAAAAAGLISWMIIGDLVYFTSDESVEYITQATSKVKLRNCRSGTEFYEERSRQPIVQCLDDNNEQVYQGANVRVKTMVGRFGVRIVSVKKA